MNQIVKMLVEKSRGRSAALGSTFSLGVKASGSLLTLAIFTLAARSMSADAFGQLTVWFSLSGFLAIAAVLGQETLISRSWGEYTGRGEFGLARGAYRFGWRTTVLSGAIFAFGLVVIAPRINENIAPATLYAAAAFLFMQTALHYSSHSSRVLSGVVVSESNREITWRIILLLVVLWAAVTGGLTPARFFFAAAIGMCVAVSIQSLAARRVFGSLPAAKASEADARIWISRAGVMWLSAVLEAASQYADVMLIGYFASPAIAGDYFVAARIANVFLMIGSGLNNYVFSHTANLFFSGQIDRLQQLLRLVISMAMAFLVPALLFVVVMGGWILTLFGERHAADYPTLMTLTLASFTMALCGPTSVILLMTGKERLYSKTIALAIAVRLPMTALLSTLYGANGAAAAWALVNAPLAIGLAFICKRACGVDPSALSIFQRETEEGPIPRA